MDYYKAGEERFGKITSRIYSVSAKLFLRKIYSYVIEDVITHRPSSVLDIGCGEGYILLNLANRLPKAKLYGIDPSIYMIKSARKETAKLHGFGPIFEQGSSRDIPFKRHFDFISSSMSFHHWKDRDKSIPYILRHLNPGGIFSIYEYNRDAMTGLFRLMSQHSVASSDFMNINHRGFCKTIKTSGKFIKISFVDEKKDRQRVPSKFD